MQRREGKRLIFSDRKTLIREFMAGGDFALPHLNDDQLLEAIKELGQQNITEVYGKMVDALSHSGVRPSNEQKEFHDQIQRLYLAEQIGPPNRSVKIAGVLGTAGVSKSGEEIWKGSFTEDDTQYVIKRVGRESPEISAVQRLGITPLLPRIIDRNMVFSRIGRFNGNSLDVVPMTVFGYADLSRFAKDAAGGEELVSMIELVPGSTGQQWLKQSDSVLSSGERAAIARDLTRIQYLDHLMTQVDRQVGNFMIVFGHDGIVTGVKAIDNDFSLAEAEQDVPHAPVLKRGDPSDALSGILQFGLPPIADETTRAFFSDLKMRDIVALAKGRLTASQGKLVERRLREINEHLKGLSGGQIIRDTDWADNLDAVSIGRAGPDDEGKPVATYYDLLAFSDGRNLLKHSLYKEVIEGASAGSDKSQPNETDGE